MEHDRVAIVGNTKELDGSLPSLYSTLFGVNLLETEAAGGWVEGVRDGRPAPSLIFLRVFLLQGGNVLAEFLEDLGLEDTLGLAGPELSPILGAVESAAG